MIRIIRAYLNRKARLPKIPEDLLQTIHAWLEPLYTKSVHNFFHKKPTTTYNKTFKVLDDRLSTNSIKVKFIPKQFNFNAVSNPNYNTIIVGIPTYLNKANLESKEELSYDLKSYLHHELIHFVQFNTEHHIGGKIQEDNYSSGDEYTKSYDQKYYQSSEELKPNLSNEVYRFKFLYPENHTKQNIIDFIKSSDFFNAIKDTNNYNKYVKDFYLLIASN